MSHPGSAGRRTGLARLNCNASLALWFFTGWPRKIPYALNLYRCRHPAAGYL